MSQADDFLASVRQPQAQPSAAVRRGFDPNTWAAKHADWETKNHVEIGLRDGNLVPTSTKTGEVIRNAPDFDYGSAPSSPTGSPAGPRPSLRATGGDPQGGANRDSVVKFWMGQGARDFVAQGIADRVGAESGFRSSAFNPNDGGSPSGGLYQHHADRLERLKAFAAKVGKDPNDADVQNQFAASEVKGGDAIAAKHWDEILAAPNRQTAAFLWDRYFERSKAGAATPWAGNITAAKGYRVSDEAAAAEQRAGKPVYWADPADLLALLPEKDDSPGEQRKTDRLRESIYDKGEAIEGLPDLSGEIKDGQFVVTDYDGRTRLQEAVKAGVTAVPVAFRGMPKGVTPKTVKGMTGVVAPFDFRAYTAPDPQRQQGFRDAAAERAAGADQRRPEPDIGGIVREVMGGLDLSKMIGTPAALDRSAEIDAAHPHVPGQTAGQMMRGRGLDDPMLSAFQPGALPGPAAVARQVAPAIGGAMTRAADALDTRAAASGQEVALSAGMTPERAALAQEATHRFNLPLTEGGKGAAPGIANQRAFNREVAKTIGEDADNLSPEVMDRARKRIGKVFDAVENGNAITIDDKLIDRLADIESAARDGLADSEFVVIKRQLANILGRTHKGDFMPGRSYGRLLRHNAPLDLALNSNNPNIRAVATEVKEALQSALERSLSGDDLAAYREARRQYRDLKTVEPIASVSPTGDIDPGRLNKRLSQRDKSRAYDTNPSPLDRLGKIGSEFLKPPKVVPTAQAGRVARAAKAVITLGGALTGHHAAILAHGHQLARGATQPAQALTERLITDALGQRRSPAAQALRQIGRLMPQGPAQPMPNAMMQFLRPPGGPGMPTAPMPARPGAPQLPPSVPPLMSGPRF